eukprot:TRINITY_DN24400_c0_g1_i2.p1 TRINITY_DN24400_c0_g1~~TRINITY_DN24400_c0_g1_i2.p1  ORF type:complete len:232 (+),score=32.54 TRINITY_DN24400_c0_g1_i2:52-747(+)
MMSECKRICVQCCFFFFFFKQKTAYEMQRGLVGSEMCIRDSMKGIMDSERTIGNDGLTRGVFSPKIKPKVSLLPICKLKQINSERNLVNPGRRLEPLEEQSGNVISRSKPREKLHLCRQKCTLKVPALCLNISRPVLPVPNTLVPVVISNTPAVKYTSSQWKKPVLSRSNKKDQIKSVRNNKKELETNNHLRFREKHHCVLSYHGSSPKLNETDYQLPNDTNFESLPCTLR